MKISFFMSIYRLVLAPIGVLLLFALAPFSNKIRQGLKMRVKASGLSRSPRLQKIIHSPLKPIWIHASSGEFEYAKPIIQKIKEQNPEQPIFVTYFSPSYAQSIEHDPFVDISCPLPLDLPGPTQGLIKLIDPSIVMIARTDLWPEFLFALQKNKIPILLFSTTFRELVGWRKIAKPYFRAILNMVHNIFAVSESDSAALQSTGTVARVTVVGDTRFDQVLARLKKPKPVSHPWLDSKSTARLLVAGSTWPEDETILISGLAPLIKSQKLKLILVPHEVTTEHLKKIEQQLKNEELSSIRYSDLVQNSTHANVLVVDKIGILAELYGFGDIAFVGGSFKSKVHSVMEPLAAGLPVLVGPKFTNNREAIEFQKKSTFTTHTMVEVVKNSKDLFIKTETLINSEELDSSLKNKIKQSVLDKTGATETLMRWLTQNKIITQSKERA